MERREDKIKILISYHKESEIIESEIMTPIQVGAKKNAVVLNMLRDDQGANVSDKNDKYCELTAQYWAWKNLDVDYYGFMHYRRHFVFNERKHYTDPRTFLWYERIDKQYKEEIGLYDEEIHKCVKDVDIILPFAEDTSSWGAVSNEVQFSCLENLHAIDFDLVCRTVIELYPDYAEAIQEFRTSHSAYWYNMFIMKKKIFESYSEWLFHILEVSEQKIDFSEYNQQETRTLAFMAERLLSIYLIKLLKDQPELKIKFLKMTMVLHTDKLSDGVPENIGIKNEEIGYVYAVEKAYKELKGLRLPYKFESLFPTNNDRLESLLLKKQIIFYGGGKWCWQILMYFDRLGLNYPVEIWDKAAETNQMIRGIHMLKPAFTSIAKRENVVWVITIRDRTVSSNVKELLKSQGAVDVIENRELVNWLSYKLWLDINN